MSEPSQSTTTTPSPKTAITIGDTLYNIDVSKIPYLSSFVSFQKTANPSTTEFLHDPIPLFSVALKGLESGYRQCFRSLPADDLSQFHTLCETYSFLCIDILNGQTINEIFNDLKSCKSDYELEYKYYREVKGNKSKARDTAFKLLYLILLGEFENETKDSAKVFNAVVFLVSHAATFKCRTRKVVRAAYEERFVVSMKQKAGLDKWEKTDVAKLAAEDEGDVTTEEDDISDYQWDSDYS